MLSNSSSTATSQSATFDKRSFVRYMKNIGKAYRKQAMELVSICRTLVQAQEQTPRSNVELRSALQAVDAALYSASEVKKGPSKEEVDEKFAKAAKALSRYEMRYHPGHVVSNDKEKKTVFERMEAAGAKDKSTSTILNRLKEAISHKAADDRQPEPTTVIEFLLCKSLPDKDPTIVRQVLGQRSNFHEILWNFSRFRDTKRLTLKENPRFYNYLDLPASQKAYTAGFETVPINDFQLEHTKICVLTDKPGRVFLETDMNTRAFGNFWKPSDAIILKDVCGKLEGESIVQNSMQGAFSSWYLEELPFSPTSQPSSPSSPLSTTTASPTSSTASGLFQDWREPIQQGLISLETDICIKPMPPSNSSPSSPAPYSPTTPAASSANDSSQSSRLQISTQTASRQIPRSPKHRRSPASRLSPGAQAPPSRTTPHQQHPTAAVSLNSQAILASVTPVASTPNRVSQGRKSQKDIKKGEAPNLLKMRDRGLSISPQSVTSAPASESTGRKHHTIIGKLWSCGDTSGQSDTRGPAKKGIASSASRPEVTSTPSRTRGGQLSRTPAWQFWNQRCNPSQAT